MTNKDVFVEIPVTDFEKAKDFYSNVLGWKVIYWQKMDYLTFYFDEVKDDNEAGGFVKQNEITNKGVLIYFTVKSVDETLNKIEKNGGKIIQEKTKIGETVGYQAKFMDCFGNIIGLYSKNL